MCYDARTMQKDQAETAEKLTYRPYIDGLRALAVLIVFIFHLEPAFLPGGYLGVDIFFVISGFVITQSLYKRYLKSGKVDIVDFYLRRFTRLYPALVVMVLLVTIAYIFIGFLWDTNLLIKSSISSILAFSNLYFIWNGENYFDQGSINPMLHTWSLGIEEQFYLVYPLLFIALMYGLKKYKLYRNSFIALSLIAVVMYVVFATNLDTLWGNYYWPLARFWELLVGCALFFLSLNYQNVRGNLLAIVGGAVLLFTIFGQPLTENLAVETLGAVLGTALIILSGVKERNFISTALSYSSVVYIGLLSYSLYLWHLPVIYFLELYLNTTWYLLLSPILTLFLGYLSYTYVEKTFRYSEKFRKNLKKSFVHLAGAGVVAVIAIVVNGVGNSVFAVNVGLNNFAQAVKDTNLIEKKASLGDRIEPLYLLDGKKVLHVCGEKVLLESDSIIEDCLASRKSKRLIYLTGDSHASHLLPAISGAEVEADVYFQGHPRQGLVDEESNSLSVNSALENKTKQLKVFSEEYDKIVIVTSFYLSALHDELDHIEPKLIEYIDELTQYAHIVLVAPTPVFPSGPASCVANGVNCQINFEKDQMRREKVLNLYNFIALNYGEVTIYDPYEFVCPSSGCTIYDPETKLLRYRDSNHISVEMSEKLSPHFTEWFNQQTWPE